MAPGRDFSYVGKDAFLKFFDTYIVKTGRQNDRIKRNELRRRYERFCVLGGFELGTAVNVGRTLGHWGIRPDSRIGGSNGCNQEYAYSGIAWVQEREKELLDGAEEIPKHGCESKKKMKKKSVCKRRRPVRVESPLLQTDVQTTEEDAERTTLPRRSLRTITSAQCFVDDSDDEDECQTGQRKRRRSHEDTDYMLEPSSSSDEEYGIPDDDDDDDDDEVILPKKRVCIKERSGVKRREHEYLGKESFLQFFETQIVKTDDRNCWILRNDLLARYHKFCCDADLPEAKAVNIGRSLSRRGIRPDVRIGGSRGMNQQYAYTRIAWAQEYQQQKKLEDKEPSPPVDDWTLPEISNNTLQDVMSEMEWTTIDCSWVTELESFAEEVNSELVAEFDLKEFCSAYNVLIPEGNSGPVQPIVSGVLL